MNPSIINPNQGLDSNQFNLSHDHKMSGRMSYLYPSLVMEVVPGDNFFVDWATFLRTLPLVAPVMTKYNVILEAFFCPNRILWDNWEDFIMNKETILPPTIRYTGDFPTIGDLGEAMGLPPDMTASGIEVSALPFAAYYKIYDDYYRDANLQPTETFVPCGDGLDNTAYNEYSRIVPRRRAWKADYFTKALPWAQRGNPVELPVSTGTNLVEILGSNPPAGIMRASGTTTAYPNAIIGTDGSGFVEDAGASNLYYDPNSSLYVDIQANAGLIADLRSAWALQNYLEKSARGGQRYIEWLKEMFNVTAQDFRLQRPEYLGSSRDIISISEVLSSVGTETAALGTMGGHGAAFSKSKGVSYRSTEHGFFMVIASVIPEAIYSQGIHRMFTRKTYLDYFLAPFEHIGEQPILNKEIWAYNATIAENDEIFGYTPRNAEYKMMQNRLTGEFRDTLAFWVSSRVFDTKPELNAEFVVCDPPTDVFAVETGDHILMDIQYNISAIRKMSLFGTPAIL